MKHHDAKRKPEVNLQMYAFQMAAGSQRHIQVTLLPGKDPMAAIGCGQLDCSEVVRGSFVSARKRRARGRSPVDIPN